MPCKKESFQFVFVFFRYISEMHIYTHTHTHMLYTKCSTLLVALVKLVVCSIAKLNSYLKCIFSIFIPFQQKMIYCSQFRCCDVQCIHSYISWYNSKHSICVQKWLIVSNKSVLCATTPYIAAFPPCTTQMNIFSLFCLLCSRIHREREREKKKVWWQLKSNNNRANGNSSSCRKRRRWKNMLDARSAKRTQYTQHINCWKWIKYAVGSTDNYKNEKYQRNIVHTRRKQVGKNWAKVIESKWAKKKKQRNWGRAGEEKKDDEEKKNWNTNKREEARKETHRNFMDLKDDQEVNQTSN